MELKQRNMKNIVLTSNTPYPSRKIRRIMHFTRNHEESKSNTSYLEDHYTPRGKTIKQESSVIDGIGKADVVDSCVGGIGVLVEGSKTYVTTESTGFASQDEHVGIPNILNTSTILYINVVNLVLASPNKNGSEQVGNEPVINKVPSSYATKLSLTSLTKANIRKLEANVPNDVDYDVWLPLALVHESSYVRVLIETNACNDISDNLVMVVPNLEENGYTKEAIHIEYEWKPSRCTACLIYGHMDA
ncbi:hypothetical protein Tco_1191291 [Tanacetum coccineum]